MYEAADTDKGLENKSFLICPTVIKDINKKSVIAVLPTRKSSEVAPPVPTARKKFTERKISHLFLGPSETGVTGQTTAQRTGDRRVRQSWRDST